MVLLDAQLCLYDRQGIFPFPSETEDAFAQRAASIGTSVEQFFSKTEKSPPFSLKDPVPYYEWDFPKAQLTTLFGARPHWIQAYYSNRGLAPWHLAMTWILQAEAEKTPCMLVQVRKRKKQTEMLAHEAVHVMRAPLGSKKYEEIFAYRTSPSILRRSFGALIEQPFEALLFLLFSLCFVGFSLFFPLLFWTHISGVLTAYLALLTLPLLRLFLRKRALKNAFLSLKQLLRSEKNARCLLFRLSDEEIDFCARNTPQAIGKYFIEKKHTNIRWRQIFASYLQEV